MTKVKDNSRRKFIGTMAAGATAGLTSLSYTAQALSPELFQPGKMLAGDDVDALLKTVGKMEHPVAYDISQAIPWGITWSNVYYMTNEATGTSPKNLGLVNVLRHHGIVFSFKDELIKKYNLGEVFGLNDPKTDKPSLRNPMGAPESGDLPLPELVGIKGLQEKGAKFCVCGMAYKVYSGAIAKNMGLNAEDVYNDFVAAKLPGIELAPSGVWVLGRLAENRIAYIDASVG